MRGPLVFLQLSEQINGGWDSRLFLYKQIESDDFGNADSNNWWMLNYTHIQSMYGDELNVTPRMGYSTTRGAAYAIDDHGS